MFRTCLPAGRYKENLVNPVNPVEKVPPQAAKFNSFRGSVLRCSPWVFSYLTSRNFWKVFLPFTILKRPVLLEQVWSGLNTIFPP